MKKKVLLSVCIALTALLQAQDGNLFFVCATNAIRKAAEAGRCRWGTFRVNEFWEDDVFQDEIDAALTLTALKPYEEAKASAGNMHNPKINVLMVPFLAAVTNTPTMRKISAYAESQGFSPNLHVSVEKFQLLERPDGRRCFYGGFCCLSIAKEGIRVFSSMVDVFRRGGYDPLDEVVGRWNDELLGLCNSIFTSETDTNGVATAFYAFDAHGAEPELECLAPKQTVHTFHSPQPFSGLDRGKLNALLGSKPSTVTLDQVLATLGRAEAFVDDQYPCCGRKEMSWRYSYIDERADGAAVMHVLRIYFSPNGCVCRWKWLSAAECKG